MRWAWSAFRDDSRRFGRKTANPQTQTIALTLVLGRCSAVTSSVGAGTTDTCHVPSSGSSSAVVLEKQDGRNETTPTCWKPPHQTKSILIMPQCFWWDYCGLKWAIFIDKMWDCVHVLVKHGETYVNITHLIHTLLWLYHYAAWRRENSVNCIAGIVFHTLIIFSRDINTLPVSSHLCSPDSQLFPADQLSKVC